jgi:hypothetical protein
MVQLPKATHTTADLIEIVGNIVHDRTMASERARHWVREGLLSPLGGRYPGTGVHRTYDDAAAVRVAVLSRLSDMGFKITALDENIQRVLDTAWKAWTQWKSGPAFLIISFGWKPLEVHVISSLEQLSQAVQRARYSDHIHIDLGKIFQEIENKRLAS